MAGKNAQTQLFKDTLDLNIWAELQCGSNSNQRHTSSKHFLGNRILTNIPRHQERNMGKDFFFYHSFF